MAKTVLTVLKLQIAAGKANPAPPVGPALGQHGLDIQGFCNTFNEATKDKGNTIIPVEITVFEDRTFSLKYKKPPAAVLIKKAINLPKGSGEPHKNKVGTITRAKLAEIAEEKMDDLNALDVDAAVNILAGTARSMGVTVEG